MGFKKLKIKIIRKRKEKNRREKNVGVGCGEENPTELQKPKIEAEVYNNRKCDWIYTYSYIPISKIKTAQQK